MKRRIGFGFMRRNARRLIVACAILAVQAGCVSNRLKSETNSVAGGADADGVFVRYTRLRVAPPDVSAFEALMKRCVAAAHQAKLGGAYDWLCYREPPCRYWLIFFSETLDGFATPHAFESFARDVGQAESAEALQEVADLLARVGYETEWQFTHQQHAAWSTVQDMHTSTHPKARATYYTVVMGREEAFTEALAARTAFLLEHNYTLPVEGFISRQSASDQPLQVVFPVSWERYHRTDSVKSFIQRLNATARVEFQRLDQAVANVSQRIEHYDADFAKELSYSAP